MGDPNGNTNTDFRNPTAGNRALDINGNMVEGDVLFLNGAECLVFFLGGTMESSRVDVAGFAANPRAPFIAADNRVGPFHEFKNSLFVDLDQDGMPEYLDTLSGQTRPFIYLSSYEGAGYKPYGIDGMPGTADDDIAGLTRLYYSSPPFAASEPIPDGSTIDNDGDGTPDPKAVPINNNSFQLISAGYDFEYGIGGYYDGDSIKLQVQGAPSTAPRPENPNRSFERDNITNFKAGILN
jgi:general secretion pathway protein G